MRNRPVYNNIQFDSDGELEMYHWCTELGIPFTYQPESIELIPAVKETVSDVKGKPKAKTMLREVSYTPDFIIKEKDIPYTISSVMDWRSSNGDIVLDVKGSVLKNGKPRFVNNPDSVKFSIIKKLAYYVKNIYINKLSVPELFYKTFVPEKARYTKTGKLKKAYMGFKTLQQYKQQQEQLEGRTKN